MFLLLKIHIGDTSRSMFRLFFLTGTSKQTKEGLTEKILHLHNNTQKTIKIVKKNPNTPCKEQLQV